MRGDGNCKVSLRRWHSALGTGDSKPVDKTCGFMTASQPAHEDNVLAWRSWSGRAGVAVPTLPTSPPNCTALPSRAKEPAPAERTANTKQTLVLYQAIIGFAKPAMFTKLGE